MEGIRDGVARDDCFLCGLLEPERYREECPRCHHRMCYQPATLVDPGELAQEIVGCARRFEAARGGQQLAHLEELLTLLHQLAPESLSVLEERTAQTLDRLRSSWQRLAPLAR